jgi:hypothetical protein
MTLCRLGAYVAGQPGATPTHSLETISELRPRVARPRGDRGGALGGGGSGGRGEAEPAESEFVFRVDLSPRGDETV